MCPFCRRALTLDDAALVALGKRLRSACGAGGTHKDGVIEVQGDHVDRLVALLQAEHWTLARAARDDHERVIEPSRSVKHAAQWVANLENHMPAELWHKPALRT